MPIHKALNATGKDFTHKELINIIRRLYRIFEKHPEKFTIGKLFGLHGHISYYSGNKRGISIDRISLDHRGEFFATIVHECLHYLYPNAEEENVLALEKKIMRELTERQIKAILKKFVENICL